MKNFKQFLLFLALCAFSASVFSAEVSAKNNLFGTPASTPTPVSSPAAAEHNGLTFTPWNVGAASAGLDRRGAKPFTIMIYMNGSDLESENGAATDDIIEMLSSGLDSRFANVVILTGGTNRWQNNVIPANECVIWDIEDGFISRVAGVGLVNMGDAGTLSSFIDFTINNYPAEKYGLIMWDHGGGSIAGYGYDEIFNNSRLSLAEMGYAFERAGLGSQNLEFLCFDSCLMATVEMAVTAADYAKYLIASEDLEPGEGYDYSFLSVLNANPGLSGAEIGMAITDYFMDFYGVYYDEALTMSVIDLSRADVVMDALGRLMERCSANLSADRPAAFKTLAGKRSGTKTFGVGSPRDNESDMVDIGDMAVNLMDLYENEALMVLAALDRAIVYNRHNSDTDLKGLSAYYIYGGKTSARSSLKTYSTLNVNNSYTNYLYDFASSLLNTPVRSSGRNAGEADKDNKKEGKEILTYCGDEEFDHENLLAANLTVWQPVDGKEGYYVMTGVQNGSNLEANALWPSINGKYVCLFEINRTANATQYAIPSRLNGEDCDIIVSFSQYFPEGIILGARKEDGYIIQKGYDLINNGDIVEFYYQEKYFGGDTGRKTVSWRLGGEIVVNGGLSLDWSAVNNEEMRYSMLLTDITQNKMLSGFISVR